MANTYAKSGAKATVAVKLPKEIFELDVQNHDLLKSAYTAYLANKRTNLAKTKTRGDVSGGGKKPWRQKGTGRARFGSTRVPIWRKGGVAHGPTGNENYAHSISGGAKKQALKQALSLKNKVSALSVIDEFEIKSAKTGDSKKLIQKLGISGNLLIVGIFGKETSKSLANLADVSLSTPRALSAYTVLNADHILLTKDAVDQLALRLGDK